VVRIFQQAEIAVVSLSLIVRRNKAVNLLVWKVYLYLGCRDFARFLQTRGHNTKP